MEKLMTVSEVAANLGISKSKIYKLTSKQAIPFVKIGSRVLFSHESIQSWIAEHEHSPMIIAEGQPL
jgi:excisionase family DNA binding protein